MPESRSSGMTKSGHGKKMLTFNDFLNLANVEVRQVVLVRHQLRRRVRRALGSLTPYALWRRRDDRFEEYQRIQAVRRFNAGDIVATFVVTPRNETLFVGLYTTLGVKTAPDGMKDPISGEPVGGLFYYDLRKEPQLDDYAGKLIIDWGEGFRAWAQRAEKNAKPVIELRKEVVSEEPWPGFRAFTWNVAEVDLMP